MPVCTRIRAILFLGIAVSGACNQDALSPADAATQSDASVCTTHSSRKSVPFVINGWIEPVQEDRAERYVIDYDIRACDVPANIDIQTTVTENVGTLEKVVVTAYVWAQDQGTPACDATITIRRLIEIPLFFPDPRPNTVLSFDLTISDGGGHNTPVRKHFEIGPGAPSCSPAAPLGAPCAADCQCTAQGNTNRVCARSSSDDPMGICAIPCAIDNDCHEAGLDYCDDNGRFHGNYDYTCVKAPSTCGCDQSHCAFGQSCASSDPSCLCRPTAAHIFGGPCTCDADCAPGGLCDPHSGCFTPCTTLSDCPPEGLFCDGRCQYGI